MNNQQNYLHYTINEIVFEHRNQRYGAYELRTHLNRRLLFGLFSGLIATLCFSLLAGRDLSVDPILDTGDVKAEPTTIEFPEPLKLPELKQAQPEAPSGGMEQPAVAFTEFRPVDNQTTITTPVNTIDSLQGRLISTTGNTLPAGLKGGPTAQTGTNNPVAQTKVYEWSEVSPMFNGGFEAMQKYIAKNIRYPAQALSMGAEGTVYISFVVNANGSISDVQVLRGIGFGCDEAASEVVAGMPVWIPGMQNKTPVSVRTKIPIKFEIED